MILLFNLIFIVYKVKDIFMFFITTTPYCMVMSDPTKIIYNTFIIFKTTLL